MKNRKTTFKMPSEEYLVTSVITLCVVIIIFSIGYVFSAMIITAPLTEKQLDACEEVAWNVYEQGEDYYIPSDFNVNQTEDGKITVSMRRHLTGHIVFRASEDGSDIMVIINNEPNALAIMTNIASGFVFVCVFLLIINKYATKLKQEEEETD